MLFQHHILGEEVSLLSTGSSWYSTSRKRNFLPQGYRQHQLYIVQHFLKVKSILLWGCLSFSQEDWRAAMDPHVLGVRKHRRKQGLSSRGIASQNSDKHTELPSPLAILSLGKQHIHYFTSKATMKSSWGFFEFEQYVEHCLQSQWFCTCQQSPVFQQLFVRGMHWTSGHFSVTVKLQWRQQEVCLTQNPRTWCNTNYTKESKGHM